MVSYILDAINVQDNSMFTSFKEEKEPEKKKEEENMWKCKSCSKKNYRTQIACTSCKTIQGIDFSASHGHESTRYGYSPRNSKSHMKQDLDLKPVESKATIQNKVKMMPRAKYTSKKRHAQPKRNNSF